MQLTSLCCPNFSIFCLSFEDKMWITKTSKRFTQNYILRQSVTRRITVRSCTTRNVIHRMQCYKRISRKPTGFWVLSADRAISGMCLIRDLCRPLPLGSVRFCNVMLCDPTIEKSPRLLADEFHYSVKKQYFQNRFCVSFRSSELALECDEKDKFRFDGVHFNSSRCFVDACYKIPDYLFDIA